MEFLSVFAWILIFYVIFVLGPVVVFFFTVFGRKKGTAMESVLDPRPCYEPFRERIESAYRSLESIGREEIRIEAADGIMLHGYWLDCGGEKTLVYVHGYRTMALENMVCFLHRAYGKGYNLLIVNQRAHGLSGGKHCMLGLMERYDIKEWMKWLSGCTRTKDIFLFGHSMGAAALALESDALDEYPVRGMVLNAGYASPGVQLRKECRMRHLPTALLIPPLSLMARVFLGIDLRESAVSALSSTDIPVFFVHGSDDKTVDPVCSEENWASCASSKELAMIDKGEHMTAMLWGGAQLEDRIFDFFDNCMLKEGKE